MFLGNSCLTRTIKLGTCSCLFMWECCVCGVDVKGICGLVDVRVSVWECKSVCVRDGCGWDGSVANGEVRRKRKKQKKNGRLFLRKFRRKTLLFLSKGPTKKATTLSLGLSLQSNPIMHA